MLPAGKQEKVGDKAEDGRNQETATVELDKEAMGLINVNTKGIAMIMGFNKVKIPHMVYEQPM